MLNWWFQQLLTSITHNPPWGSLGIHLLAKLLATAPVPLPNLPCANISKHSSRLHSHDMPWLGLHFVQTQCSVVFSHAVQESLHLHVSIHLIVQTYSIPAHPTRSASVATVTGGRPNGGVVTWCMAQSVQSSFSHALYSVAANQAGKSEIWCSSDTDNVWHCQLSPYCLAPSKTWLGSPCSIQGKSGCKSWLLIDFLFAPVSLYPCCV